ncbi:MAPEG family protein [Methylobacterium sp. J-068]|uniref:MAPEG family protein n=1 Tax=Methylobacterium sp. J-068 TaxID=2836649 RepID=UPI001FBA162F|nr:MAPEG family protein [Methylobacterium sp. J-068]MCJ2037184.1 MAPEG family protein [Methylobacterium sp. J-068]
MTDPRYLVLWPVLAQIGLTFALYAWLSAARVLAVRSGEVRYGCFELGRDEPVRIARITRNLANQFELPVIVFACVALLVAFDAVTAFDVWAGWIFFVGRVVHSGVQTLTDDVPLRGRVFLINTLGCAMLVGHLGLVALRG